MAEPLPGLKRAQFRYRIKQTDPNEDYVESKEEKEELRKKRNPLSLEQLLKERENARIKASRPKFMSKQERAKAAMENRKREVEEIRAKQNEQNEKRKKYEMDGAKEFKLNTKIIEQGDTRRLFADVSRTRIKDITGKPNAWVSPAVSDEARRIQEMQRKLAQSEAERADEAYALMSKTEMEAIKESYLGRQKAEEKRQDIARKRKQRAEGHRNVNFDWDTNEDTTDKGGENPLYAQTHTASMYGRGQMAGFDKSFKVNANDFYKEKNERFRFFCDGLRRYNKEQVIEIMDEPTEISRGINKKRNIDLEGRWDMRTWEEKKLEEMTERDWRILKEDFAIATKGGNIPRPLRSWEESKLPERMLKLLTEIEYHEPTPVQRACIPIGLQNRDLIGVAETGSGKTCAFLLPLITWMSQIPKEMRDSNFELGPYALILTPTRELAIQIKEEADKFGEERFGIRTHCVIGGIDRGSQGFDLQQGVDIVVGCPGRLKDMLESHYLALGRCTYVVMDEADRMLDMGNEPEVLEIMKYLPVSNEKPDDESANEYLDDCDFMTKNFLSTRKYRQTVMFTATMPPAVERLAKSYMRRPATVTIGEAGKPTDRIRQEVHLLNHEEHKKARLMSVLQGGFEPPVIIFVNSRKGAELLTKNLCKIGYPAVSLHGRKGQEHRQFALESIKNKTKEILVATDVAGRGIDIKDVSLVINFDMAKTVEQYVHRIGRTGRAGNTGVAVTFLTGADAHCFYELKQLLIESPMSKCPAELDKHPEAQQKMTMKDMGHFWAAKQNEKEYSRR